MGEAIPAFPLHWAAPINDSINLGQLPLGQPLDEHFAISYSQTMVLIRLNIDLSGKRSIEQSALFVLLKAWLAMAMRRRGEDWLNWNPVRPISNVVRGSRPQNHEASVGMRHANIFSVARHVNLARLQSHSLT
jgi:hypothetical protein